MTRPARNRLMVAGFVVVAFFAAPRIPNALLWTATAVATPLLLAAWWVTLPFQRARGFLRKQQYEEAATELAAFESSLTAGWKRGLASMAVGLYTSSPAAASRNTLGAVRLEQGRLDDAQTHFKAALEHDALYAVPWGNLAVLAAMRGDAAGAEDARLKAATLGFKPKVLSAVIKDKLAAAGR